MIKSRARQAVKAMSHQVVSLAHDKKSPSVYDCSDPGTGKTFVRIMAFAERRRKRGGCALVLATRSLLKNVWFDDFGKFAPDMTVSVARADDRAEAFGAEADVYVTNHDAVKWLVKQPKKFWDRFSELIIDESTAYKHHTSQRSRAVAKIAHLKNFVRKSAMTGTPNGNSITDVWHQVYLLDKGQRLGPSFYAFRNTVCTPEQVSRNVNALKWSDRDGAEEAVFGLLSDIVIRHKFEDCVDIPAHHEYTVDYELTAKQRKAYEAIERDHLLPLLGDKTAQVRARLKGLPFELSAVNAAAVATKLLQVASGAVYDNDGGVHFVDDTRYMTIMDLVEERKHPLVFFYWQHQRDCMVAEAKKRGLRYAVLDGSTTDREREAIVMQYQAGFFDVLFGHPRSVAHGLTLTRGTSTIWPGPTYDLELFKQGNKRQHRIGQKHKTEVIVLVAKDTIEPDVYEILQGKNRRMTNLLDLFDSLKSNVDLRKAA